MDRHCGARRHHPVKFPFIKEVPEFKPRKTLVSEPGPIEPKQLLEAFDCLEQKVDYANGLAVQAWNTIVIVSIVLLALQGPQIISLVQRWLNVPHSMIAAEVAPGSEQQSKR